MTEQEVREYRLMVFTSLLRTLGFVSHSRVLQCYRLFNQFVAEFPLDGDYNLDRKISDHKNMKVFIDYLKEGN